MIEEWFDYSIMYFRFSFDKILVRIIALVIYVVKGRVVIRIGVVGYNFNCYCLVVIFFHARKSFLLLMKHSGIFNAFYTRYFPYPHWFDFHTTIINSWLKLTYVCHCIPYIDHVNICNIIYKWNRCNNQKVNITNAIEE